DENDDEDDSENGDDETDDGDDETDDEDDETDDEHDEEECEDESEMEECTVPTNVSALVLNSNEVWILWEGESVGSYLVSYRTDGSDWIEIETEDQEVFIEELEPGEAYEFFVQTLCDEDESLSSEIEKFYMPEESDGCSMPTYSNVFESQDGFVIIVWQESEDAEGYELLYRSKGSDEEWLLIRTEENVVEFEDIDIEVEYEYQVRVNCDGEWSEWSVIFDNSIENQEDLTTGTDDLSRERAVAKKMKINVYPNPTSDIIQFSIVTDSKTTLHIQLFDIVGKPYQLINRNAQKGENTYELEIENLSSGTYFLSVKDMVSQLEGTSRLMVMIE
ncbi:MAG: fibronectin type III domain-containing protein, partial [Saprospiraceae bacterium]|nr:fibronectin type III domain-containing protein [Saprospiraceae bacterium]